LAPVISTQPSIRRLDAGDRADIDRQASCLVTIGVFVTFWMFDGAIRAITEALIILQRRACKQAVCRHAPVMVSFRVRHVLLPRQFQSRRRE